MRFMTAACSVLVSVLLATPTLFAADQEGQGPPQSRQSAPVTRRVPSIVLSEDGKLSVTVSRARLAAVMAEISKRAKLPIVLADTLNNDFASSDIRDLPLDEALRQLLAAYDVFYLYTAPDEKSPGSIKAVWIFGRGDGKDLQPVPPALWAGTRELERQLEDPNPEVRSNSYEMLIERQGELGLDTVQKGLSDPDETVRLRTLSAAMDADVDIPAQDLEALILDATAQSQAVRILALQAIQSKPEAEAVALTLRNDPDDVVRDQARQILERLRKPPG